jgi:hypothetical protein
VRVLCDFLPKHPLNLYLFGQTPDNQESVLGKAVELAQNGRCESLNVMEDPDRPCGYAGGTVWTQMLRQRLGDCPVPIQQLAFPSRDGATMLHTYGEAIAIVAVAKKQGWETLGVVAQPLHQVRALWTTVSVALREYPSLRVYSVVGHPLPWGERVIHSQGTTAGIRASLIQGEAERLVAYRAKGDLVSEKEVLEYLERRDATN